MSDTSAWPNDFPFFFYFVFKNETRRGIRDGDWAVLGAETCRVWPKTLCWNETSKHERMRHTKQNDALRHARRRKTYCSARRCMHIVTITFGKKEILSMTSAMTLNRGKTLHASTMACPSTRHAKYHHVQIGRHSISSSCFFSRSRPRECNLCPPPPLLPSHILFAPGCSPIFLPHPLLVHDVVFSTLNLAVLFSLLTTSHALLLGTC